MSNKNLERRSDLIQKFLNRELTESEQKELQNLAEHDPSVGKDISMLQRARKAKLMDRILSEFEHNLNSKHKKINH